MLLKIPKLFFEQFFLMFIVITFNLANCGPLNAVLGRFSSGTGPFSPGGFFGRLVRGPLKENFKIYVN